MSRLLGTIYHIPVCPFSQRLEILLELKGSRDRFNFEVIDITIPRPQWLLDKTGGTTSLPIYESAEGGQVVKESMVIMNLIEHLLPNPAIAAVDPYERAIEGMMESMISSSFTTKGYMYVLNQDIDKREAHRSGMLADYKKMNDFLVKYSPNGTYLFENFGWVETIFTPMLMRFWFLEYYEDFTLPAGDREEYARVRKWIDASVAHPAAQQVNKDEIIKLYYDYAKGAGNGALVPGRTLSSFVFEPDWRARPMPPRDKYGYSATDTELGLTVRDDE